MRSLSSLSAMQKALVGVPGGQAWSTTSRVYKGGAVSVEAETSIGRRLMTASPSGNRFAVRVENYPRIKGQDDRIGSTIEFTASPKWVEDWRKLAHERSLGSR